MTLKNSITELLKNVVDHNIVQNENGSFPEGHNGPHADKETPVRTTSHMLFILCWLIEQGYDEYKLQANRAVNYLLSPECRPMKAAFWCRKNPDKDFSNGLVGQAWVLEALIKSNDVFKREDVKHAIEDVFLKHKWSETYSCWHSLNVDGSNGSLNKTFNQQLWFAYIGLYIDNEEANRRADLFIEKVLPNIELYNDGVIYHDTLLIGSNLNLKSNIKDNLFRLKHVIQRPRIKKEQRLRSVGYHGFNLTPLVYIQKKKPDAEFFQSKKYLQCTNVMNSKFFIGDMKNNPFSYPYNPIGFELANFFEKNNKLDLAQYLIREQLSYVVSNNKKIKILDTKDRINSIARLYEVCRIDLDRTVND
jgi:hypothetical protein